MGPGKPDLQGDGPICGQKCLFLGAFLDSPFLTRNALVKAPVCSPPFRQKRLTCLYHRHLC